MSVKLEALILGISFFLSSCNGSSNQNVESSPGDTKGVVSDQQVMPANTTEQDWAAGQVTSGPDSVIELAFPKGRKSLRVKGHLDKPGDAVIYSLTVNKSVRLSGRIVADTIPANIRFNQIIMPNGQSDGPFGQELEYSLPEQGVYRIKIGHSLMAENAFVGDFLLYLTVE